MSESRISLGRILLRVVLFAILAVVLYLMVWPVPIEPTSWKPPRDTGFDSGTFTRSTELAPPTMIARDVVGPEALTFDSNGRLVTGLLDGRVVRVDQHGRVERIADTGGRPLGMVYGRDGTLYVADALRGLLAIAADGTVTVLVDSYQGRRMAFVDDVTLLPDGRLLFTDASDRFGLHEYELDLIEHRPRGRVFAYDPATRTTTLIASHLYFANGIAASRDGSYAVVCETGSYTLRRIELRGPHIGRATPLVEGLPGFCDNVRRSEERDLFWVALPARRNPALDATADKPLLRKVIVRLPTFLQPRPETVTTFVAVWPDGGIAVSAAVTAPGAYGPVTTVLPHGGSLYLGSLSARGIARFDPMPALVGLEGRTEGN